MYVLDRGIVAAGNEPTSNANARAARSGTRPAVLLAFGREPRADVLTWLRKHPRPRV